MPEAKAGARRGVLISAVAAVLLLGLLIALIVVVAKKEEDPTPPLPPTPVVKTDTETFIDVSDGLTLQWYSGDIAVKGDLTNIAGNKYNVANLPVRKSPTGVFLIGSTSITVAEAMETTKMSKLVLKLNLMPPSSDDVTTALNAFVRSGNPNVIIVSVSQRRRQDRVP
ncbi:uncharacterized protein LOC127842239 [Dreissena polymorpha]|uniref:Uncharacterized protein n=1 Tax=Dreissena polymorpha TaxID=45954 RepID=A0A9D4EIE7_DREPO|nr:uncharacterized protein LOC127842239 [Dreissena polymorpha]KAH3780220.1 hypothetical protein DPMN_158031 [Dreissena polymorpha]